MIDGWVRGPADELALAEGCAFDEAAGRFACDFLETFCRLSAGKWAGEPLRLFDWQRDYLMRLFGWKNRDGRRRFRTSYLEVAKKNGKAMKLDTPLPTPDGWTTMGRVRVGDILFNERGHTCRVIATTAVMADRPCYEVRFSDGEALIVDAQHEWRVSSRNPDRGLPAVKTTELLSRQVWLSYRGSEGWNHSIAVAGALDLPDADLPIPPYVLGAWLGDGHSSSATITCSYADCALIEEIRGDGVAVIERRSSNANSGVYRLSEGRGGRMADKIQARLRRLGLLGNKHIPAGYLRASYRQRLALLQGLMDTDGYCSPRGQCEFTTTLESLRDGFLELARSLGFKPTLKSDRATIAGRDCGPKYRIQFFAFDDQPAFRLQRKRRRQKPWPGVKPRSLSRHIVAVERVQSTPVRCIEVDSPSHLFLAGRSMIPTHNSSLVAALAVYLLLADGEGSPEVHLNAVDRDQASIVFNEAKRMVEQSPELAGRLEVVDSRKRIVHPASRGVIRANSADVASKDGVNASAVIFDELHRQKSREMWDIFAYASVAREQPLRIAITTAGEEESGPWFEQRDYSEKVNAGIIPDASHLGVVYRAMPADDPEDPATWRKANPSLGVTIKEEDFARELAEARPDAARWANFARLRLNLVTRADVAFIDLAEWDACSADPSDDGGPIYAGLDLSDGDDLSALCWVAGDPEEALDVRWKFWLPEDNIVNLERRHQVPYRAWAERGLIELTPGNVIDYAHIRRAIVELAAEGELAALLVDPYNATGLSIDLREQDGLPVETIRQGYLSLSAPTKELRRLIRAGRLRHGGHPVARWHAANAVAEQDAAGNIKLSKRKSRRKIDGMAALVNAIAGKGAAGDPAGEWDPQADPILIL